MFKKIKNFFKQLFCHHEGGELVRAYRAVDYDHTRKVWGVLVCPKCGHEYFKDVDRFDPNVQRLLSNE